MATGSGSGDALATAKMGTTQFLHATLAENKPIFSRSRINYTPSVPVTHVCAANRRITLVLANKSVVRVDQSKADANLEVVELAKAIGPKAKINQAFIDPRGNHLLLTLKSTDQGMLPDLVYLSRKSTKPKMSTKIRGNLVTAVGWCHTNENESTTGTILMGTTRGLIFETDLDSGDERMFTTALEQYWKQIFDLGRGQHVPITALDYHPIPRTKKYYIMATTPHRLYQFIGNIADNGDKPVLQQVFADYIHQPGKFIEMPTSQKVSYLSFNYTSKDTGKLAAKYPLTPKKFGWMTEPGIYAGDIDTSAYSSENKAVTVNCQLVPLPELNSFFTDPAASGSADSRPMGLVVTEFHALLLYSNRVRGICLLNEQIVFDDAVDVSGGPLRGIVQDHSTGLIYVFSEYAVHKYSVDQEARNVWKVYLEKEDFPAALRYSANDEDKMDQIYTKQALHAFDAGNFIESAMYYAKTRASFEEIALKFMQVEEKTALLNFLKKRLELVKASEKTQLTMIVMWLVEIYLNMMSHRVTGRATISSAVASHDDDDEEDDESAEEAFADQTSQELLTLMKQPKVAECIANNRNTFYDLLSCHGDKGNLIKFATILDDHERVIQYHLQDGSFSKVMSILLTQHRPDLYYTYGPTLMQSVPKAFVDAAISEGRRLAPVKLIPSLVVSSRLDQELEAIRYLEFSITKMGSKDPAIHNFLISLYVKHQNHKLMTYLTSRGRDPDDLPYDLQYTLRLCGEHRLKRECVLLHAILGQLDEAAELALQVDMDCAKSVLEFAQGNEVQLRKIWLLIAKHVVREKNDIKTAMEFLQECNGLVKIEDILPFFPDFVTIDHFKDAICDSLQDYSKHIHELKDEMEEAYRSAETIRSEIQQFKSRFTFVRATDVCSICNLYLMSRPFHLFTCSHKFHTDCLMEEVLPHLTAARRRKVEELRAELAVAKRTPEDIRSVDSSQVKVSRIEQIRSELDNLVAGECIFCGDVMVRMIDKPFIEEDDYDRVLAEWS